VPVYEHVLPHAATSRASKLTALRQAMQAKGATHHWIATLDDLAWVLNLRGADVDYNPVFIGHALVSLDAVTLFVAPGKVPADVQERLSIDGVQCRPYDEALSALRALPTGARLLIDPKRITWGLREAVPDSVAVIESINPTTLAKSRKTDAEAAFVREAMERDGAAMCAFYAWL
jgi:Xaa-Pro aminopeptidase